MIRAIIGTRWALAKPVISSRRFLGGAAAAFLLWCVGVWIFGKYYEIGANRTASMPGYYYLVLKYRLPRRGDLIAFRLPPGNRYYPDGMLWVKVASGVGGDFVNRDQGNYYINGLYQGYAKPLSLRGDPLAPGPVGLIPDGHYYVHTPHQDSYDSRYRDIGWIPLTAVVGTAYRIF